MLCADEKSQCRTSPVLVLKAAYKEGSVPVVRETVPLDVTGRQRQDWIFAIKCLNGRLFVHENTTVNDAVLIEAA